MTNYYELLRESQTLLRLQGASEDTVKNAFFANYLTALVLLKLHDLKGLMLINDHAHSKLTRFSPSMSDLNFWGRALFYSSTPDVKNRMLTGHADLLSQDAQRVTASRIQATMQVPLTAPEVINWNEVCASLILFRERFGIQSSYYVKTVRALLRWESLNEGSRKQIVNTCFMYLLQSDPRSALLPRLRALSSSVMIAAADSLAMKLVGFKKLHEDGEATSTGNVSSVQGASNGIVSPPGFDLSDPSSVNDLMGTQYSPRGKQKKLKKNLTVKDGKIIRKRVKEFKVRRFKAPEFLRVAKKTEGERDAE